MTYTASYSPDDNKLRLYAVGRLPADVYARVKAAGFKWAPKQDLFVAPMWTPGREDLLLELCGEIGDDDTSLAARAEERAERFEDYSDKRAKDAESARKAVSAIADNIPFGQPILIGHHSERHARKDAEKIENGMRRAVRMWQTSEYWTERAAGAISHAKYKERPDVRARRIKGIEADLRKVERGDKESAASLRMFDLIDLPEKWKQGEGAPKSREERAAYIAGRVNANVSRKNEQGYYWTAFDVLRLPAEERYKAAPVMTIDEVLADVRASFESATVYRARWADHYRNRLAYERAMLADAGGTVADKTGPEKGGAVRCWCSPGYGKGWSYIQKVNRVSVSVLDNYGNSERNFSRVMPLDKLLEVMPAAKVAELKAAGRLAEIPGGSGFYVRPEGDGESRAPTRAEAAHIAHQDATHGKANKSEMFAAMAETLRTGVQVVTAPQLFPTPRDLAQRVADLADIQPGERVLEPSAGTGAILGAMGGRMFAHNPERGEVVAVELNAKLAERLRTEFPLTKVQCADFLQLNGDLGAFDRVLMNPPFENGADIKHIQHALSMLKPNGRLVAICANGPRQVEKLQPLASSWEDLPAGTFAGTGVRAALIVIDKESSQ